jgi:hypothetical protein
MGISMANAANWLFIAKRDVGFGTLAGFGDNNKASGVFCCQIP